LAKKRSNTDHSQEDLLRPFWFDMPSSFYTRVNKGAKELGITRKQLVSRAVDQFIEEARKEKRRQVLPTTPIQEELVKEFQRKAGSLRWKNTTPEERKEMMRKISETRWSKQRQKKPSRKS
jgi:hypothetical protein